jgi:hypothetical protein
MISFFQFEILKAAEPVLKLGKWAHRKADGFKLDLSGLHGRLQAGRNMLIRSDKQNESAPVSHNKTSKIGGTSVQR